jgi:hypothetical protein
VLVRNVDFCHDFAEVVLIWRRLYLPIEQNVRSQHPLFG